MVFCPICFAESTDSAQSRCPIVADWGDNERMSFLTSFPAPDDSNAREQMVDFWSKAVTHAYKYADKLSLDLGEVAKSSLAWDGTMAPGLGLSIRSLVSSGKLVPRIDVEIGKGVTRRLLETPLTYLMGMLSLGGNQESLPRGQYVHMDVLEDAARIILRHCQHLPDEERTLYLQSTEGPESRRSGAPPVGESAPWSFPEMCRAAFKSNPEGSVSSTLLGALNGEDILLVAKHLLRTKRAVSDEGVLKIAGQGRGGTRTALLISETDRDLLRLRCTVASLQTMASDLERRIKERRRDAVKADRDGQKREALMHLRRMKECQGARNSRLNSLYTLEKALDQVKKLRIDKQVLEAHEAATKALKSCREAYGLSVAKVEDTMDALAEEMAEQEGIAEALGKEDSTLDDPDEKAALELELESLLEEVGEAASPTCVTVERPTGVVGLPARPTLLEGQPSGGGGDIEGYGNCRNDDADEVVTVPRDSRADTQVSTPLPA